MIAPTFDGSFVHNWTAEILPNRPMILPSRHFVYPGQVEEVESGALEVLVQPSVPQPGTAQQPFLATCALGFRDPAVPSGIWSMPNPDWLCAVSGGYAYLIDVADPRKFTMLRYRPVLNVLHYLPDILRKSSENLDSPPDKADSSADGLLLFVGHRSILAWGQNGEVWETDRLSAEGVTVDRIEGKILHGHGWDLMTDRDVPFALNLDTGERL